MRILLAVSVITLMLVSLTSADELHFQGGANRYNKTLADLPLPQSRPALGRVKGFIQSVDGALLSGGEVYFFNDVTGPPPAPEKYWRVPDRLETLDDDGGFSADLPPGRYFVGAIKRKGGHALIGPPSVGDMYYAGNIVYEVLPGAENDLGVISGAKPFSIDIAIDRNGVTAIEGLVSNTAGKAVEGAVVFAHIKQEMSDRPLFVSTKTGKDGVFRLRVSGGGTFYLRVRNYYGGGMPVSGAIMGVYGGDNPKAVTVKKGEVLKGINLTGIEFAMPNRTQNNKSRN